MNEFTVRSSGINPLVRDEYLKEGLVMGTNTDQGSYQSHPCQATYALKATIAPVTTADC